MACPTQIRCGGSQRPATAVDSNLCAYLFKLAVAQIVKQIFSATILGVLETVGHDARRGQVPQINVFGVVATDEEIQQSVAVIIKPDRGIAVNPRRKAGLFADAREAVALIVVKQFGPPPLDQK